MQQNTLMLAALSALLLVGCAQHNPSAHNNAETLELTAQERLEAGLNDVEANDLEALAGKRGRITGSFVQPWFVEWWSEADWQKEFKDLKEARVDDHIIWQWTVDSLNKTTYYPTNLPGYTKRPGALADPVEYSLQQAQKQGLKVWLGLNWTDQWWQKYANDEAWLKNEFNISKQVADELWARYGKKYRKTIAGFYMTMEVDNYNFSTPETQNRMKAVYRDVTNHIHRHMRKPVMIAPFFNDNGGMRPAAWKTMWENILSGAAIDVINMQDGCGASDDGVTPHATPETIGAWFKATREAIRSTRPRTHLWSDLETFNMEPGWQIVPVRDFSRIQRQIDAVKPYVTRISSFAVMHYQTRVGSTDPRAAEQYELLKQQQGWNVTIQPNP